MDGPVDIGGLSLSELTDLIISLGEPSYRAKQVYAWIHRRGAGDFEEMSDIPARLRMYFKDHCRLSTLKPLGIERSRTGDTIKYAFGLFDGEVIESVYMRHDYGRSVCVSSQVGCAMGCRFCASTLSGCARNLSAAEILAQIYRIGRDVGERISHVDIMGSGEPLMNYAAVVKALRMLTDGDGAHISARNISLSTCGIPEGIRKLADEGLRVRLCLSLHAPEDGLRAYLMPGAARYPLREVLSACRYYYDRTGRRVSFEYTLIKGINDSLDMAYKLKRLLGIMGSTSRGGSEGPYHINLIALNPVCESGLMPPDRADIMRFKDALTREGINATLRRSMGGDIDSACGQLRRRHI